MALTNKGDKWERQNSLYLIMSFIPFLNAFCFMYMYDRTKHKPWRILMWITIAVSTVTIALFSTLNSYAYTEIASEGYNNINEAPSINDFATQDYIDSFKNENGSYKEEWYETEEYKAYEKADAEYNKQKETDDENNAELQKAKKANERFQNSVKTSRTIFSAVFLLYNLFAFVYLLLQRGKFLQMYSGRIDTMMLQERLNNR